MRKLRSSGRAETPPRAWGRRVCNHSVYVCCGNTPTSVGKTLAPARRPTRCGKHPHERGEDPRRTGISTLVTETPPRAWGRRSQGLPERQRCRNTPTSVGKTYRLRKCSALIRKHPHERGEDISQLTLVTFSMETPPRAWGRQALLRCFVVVLRNTPTSVGKTRDGKCGDCRAWKHPHERGEDEVAPASSRLRSETPPRAWGRHFNTPEIVTGDGNTPTSVGKTASVSRMVLQNSETPPRAWGRRKCDPSTWGHRGNTPTSVGKTRIVSLSRYSRQKHPHERGEDEARKVEIVCFIETPPRAWGRPRRG